MNCQDIFKLAILINILKLLLTFLLLKLSTAQITYECTQLIRKFIAFPPKKEGDRKKSTRRDQKCTF